ncbi:MAG: sulfur carrier protein ThiS [Chloroherpetonaceae bacterium]|nr:sulfur carrier protein ThiS [Chloroherpetonaceae bacterium]MCS7210238.1 sulfur carrier protein ThiS [Chloroherpetonaceae bacterium]MDW8019150.1 sulfur carrier protein ThiS [Chloroherpetonaceae bacterium]MDW8466900.1 sulfur carrier protein ThiS [Chloroherpetonaceae bacterium]
MHTITLNGKPHQIDKEMTVAEFLQSLRISPDEKGIAVAINEAVINKQAWGRVRIKPDDVVEVIRATQGG